jgi:hypothetical protein
MTLYPTFFSALLNADQPPPNELKARSGNNVDHRFDVYRNNVMASLLNALNDTFPVTAQLTGTDFFRAMARLYVLQSPPATPVLVRYGDTFPDFIAGFAPAGSLPYLADVARLEFAWLSCYHSADHVPIAPETLRRCLAEYVSGFDADEEGEDALFIELAPSTRVVASPYPIFSIWSAHQPESAFELSEIDLSQPQSVLLTRANHDVCLDLVSTETARCLLKAEQGVLSNELFEAFDFDLAALLALLIQREAVAGLNNNTKGA